MAEHLDKIVYPPGVRELTPDISTDEFVKRLKDCAQAFQVMIQEEDNTAYIPLALHLASELFLEHRSQDVRLIAACCLADIFRIYAPDPPFTDLNQVKVIFEFFIEQLKGLRNPNSPSFKRYFYLLENFACVRTFNLCVELDNCKDIFLSLFNLMFQIIRDINNNKIKNTILDMLALLLSETDVVHQEVLDVILVQVVEPNKSQNKNACLLAQDLIRRSAAALEPYIQNFFNNALFLPRSTQSVLSRHLFDLIYELNTISSFLMAHIIPQLEYKLKSSSLDERLQVAKVVARMFADKHSKMIIQNHSLWTCFLARFNDIDPQVRILCSEFSKPILLNHPEAKEDLTEQLKPRSRDPNEDVRYAVVMAILGAARTSFTSINEELLSFIKERTLDKKFRIRKEALLGLAQLYKVHSGIGTSTELSSADIESISWIKNKILHVYYQNSIDDRILVQRILNTCLVPYQRPVNERMKMLYKLFCTIDENAARAFTEILKSQKNLRSAMENIVHLIQLNKTDERENMINKKVLLLTKHFQDPPGKVYSHFLKFFNSLRSNHKVHTTLTVLLHGNMTSSEAEKKVKGILNTLGNPVAGNPYYTAIKALMESIAPVMLDREGVKLLVSFVKDSLMDNGAIEAELGLQNSSQQGFQLLLVLSYTLPLPFQSEETYNNLILFLQVGDELAIDTTLQILRNVSKDLEHNFRGIYGALLPHLVHFVKTGNPKQAKHAVYCLHNIVSDKERVFGEIVSNLKSHLTIESGSCRTALVSIGHIAYLCHNMFAPDFKQIVSSIVVKQLLMLEEKSPSDDDITWGPLESLSDETKIKIAGMKVMIRWLTGLKDMVQPTKSTLTLLTTVILHGGDLLERQHTGPVAKSWMRLSAAICILKLCHEPIYAAAVPLEQFQVLASVMSDPCPEVRERFAQKLYKGLVFLKLPIEFVAILSLSALDSNKEFRIQVKKFLITSINKRRAYVKDRNLSKDDLARHLPDNALQYAVHLLAHLPFFEAYNDIPSLYKIKECLNLLFEALMFKHEDYNYAYFKRLLENIKQTKDIQNPDDEVTNFKMYAVCDLALNIIMSKGNFFLKDFPAEPTLNPRFFTDVDRSYSNLKTYLPPEFIKKEPVKTGFEIVAFEDSGSETASSISQSKSTKSQTKPKLRSKNVPSTSLEESSVQEDVTLDSTFAESDASEQISQNLSKSSEDGEPNLKSSDPIPPVNPNTPPNSTDRSEVQEERETPVNGITRSSSRNGVSSCSHRATESEGRKRSVIVSSTRSSRKATAVSLRSTRSLTSKSSDLTSVSPLLSDVTIPTGTPSSITSTDSYSHLIKECSVYLQKDAVENYTASLSPSDDSPKQVQNHIELLGSNDVSNASSSISSLTDENIPKRNTRSTRKIDLNVKSTTVLSKRKRDVSESQRSVRSKTSSSSPSSKSSESPTNPIKSPIKNGGPLKEIMELQQSKPNSNHTTESPTESNASIRRLKRDASPSTRSVRSRSANSSPITNSPTISTSTRSSIKSFLKNGRPLKEIKTLQQSKNGLNHISESPKKTSNSNKKLSKEQIAVGVKDNVRKTVSKTVKSQPVSQTQRSTRQNKKIELKTNSKRR